MLTKENTLLEKGPWVKSSGVNNIKEKKKISVLLTLVSKAYSELITDQPSRSGVYYYFLIGFFFFSNFKLFILSWVIADYGEGNGFLHSSTLAWKIPWTESLVVCSPWSC